MRPSAVQVTIATLAKESGAGPVGDAPTHCFLRGMQSATPAPLLPPVRQAPTAHATGVPHCPLLPQVSRNGRVGAAMSTPPPPFVQRVWPGAHTPHAAW